MHYKNGRIAQNGDPVIGYTYDPPPVSNYEAPMPPVIAGIIHSIQPASQQCNCTVAVPIPGGVEQRSCMTVGKLYHAQDGFAAMEAQQKK